MIAVPSRASFTALTDRARTVIPSLAVGFVRELDAGASVLYTHPHGISEYRLSAADIPDVLAPHSRGVRYGETHPGEAMVNVRSTGN
jgi:hypothetical protein